MLWSGLLLPFPVWHGEQGSMDGQQQYHVPCMHPQMQSSADTLHGMHYQAVGTGAALAWDSMPQMLLHSLQRAMDILRTGQLDSRGLTRLGRVAADQLEHRAVHDLGCIEGLLCGVVGDHQGKDRLLGNALHLLQHGAACQGAQINASGCICNTNIRTPGAFKP